jgi:integrase
MSRRGQGEGSIYKRADGRWCAVLDLGILDGRRRRRVKYARTRKEAGELLRKMQTEHEQGIDLAADRQTVATFLEYWLQNVVKKNNRPKTLKTYDFICRMHIKPHIGHIQLDKLRAQHVQMMLNKVSESVSITTTRYARSVLVIALNHAVRWGYVARNVAQVVEPPPAQKYEAQLLTEEQAGRFLAAVAGHRLEPLYRVALGLGLRQGEILALKWADVDLQGATLTVKDSKTPHGRRTLRLPPVLVRVLQQHWSGQQQERRLQGTNWQEHGRVFTGTRGKPILDTVLRAHFKTTLKRAGLSDTIRFHDLRHSFASFLIAQGEHPRVIMQIMGHSSISITMDIYGHIFEDKERSALDDLNSRLQSGYTGDNENML